MEWCKGRTRTESKSNYCEPKIERDERALGCERNSRRADSDAILHAEWDSMYYLKAQCIDEGN